MTKTNHCFDLRPETVTEHKVQPWFVMTCADFFAPDFYLPWERVDKGFTHVCLPVCVSVCLSLFLGDNFWTNSVADPGFPVGGGVDLVGGAVDPRGSYILKILHVKTKESGPAGGTWTGCAPLDPPMQLTYWPHVWYRNRSSQYLSPVWESRSKVQGQDHGR